MRRIPVKTLVSFGMAALVLVIALIGGRPLGIALAMAGVLVAFGLLLLIGGRSESVQLIRAQGHDERQRAIHTTAMAVVAQVLILAVVTGYLVQLATDTLDAGSPFLWLGVLGGSAYIASLVVLRRRV